MVQECRRTKVSINDEENVGCENSPYRDERSIEITSKRVSTFSQRCPRRFRRENLELCSRLRLASRFHMRCTLEYVKTSRYVRVCMRVRIRDSLAYLKFARGKWPLREPQDTSVVLFTLEYANEFPARHSIT